MILPVITLIGQKNVGKSTLFNRLTCTNDALVADYAGLTRDRQYGYLYCKLFKSILVDTGGIDKFYSSDIVDVQSCIYKQTVLAIKESDMILFVVDGRCEETTVDYSIIDFLRKLKKNIFIIINKIDDIKGSKNCVPYGYYRFGIENVFVISAMHGYGINYLLKKISYQIEEKKSYYHTKNCVLIINQDLISKKYKLKRLLSISSIAQRDFIVLAVVGRPNSGKSTFINNILGTNRMITCNVPGTTRDSIYTSTMYYGRKYILVDTAGIIKKKFFSGNTIEQVFVRKTFQVIKDVHIILFMINVDMDIAEKDLSILKYVMNIGISLIIVVNKWDNVPIKMRCRIKEMIFKQIDCIGFVQVHFISALYENGFKSLFHSIQMIYDRLINMRSIINTSKLIRIMRMAVIKRSPPLFNGSIKIRPKYIHVGGYNPLILIIHGTYVSKLSSDYQRYLKKCFYKNLNIDSIMLHIQFKDSDTIT